MSDLKHDPEFPYVVLIREDHGPDNILGKFSDIAYATQLKNAGIAALREVVDTTPKPKIPDDAQHITWGKKQVAYSRHYDGLWYGWNHGRGLSEAELLTWIGDDEVTVLVHKEES